MSFRVYCKSPIDWRGSLLHSITSFALRFEIFTCGAILGRSSHHLALHMSRVAIRDESRSSPASYIGFRQLLRNSTHQQKNAA
jgi:hypothetical protein